MSEDVVAVLADAPYHDDKCPSPCYVARHPEVILAALAEAGYAVVKLPEGVAVGHGARLVPVVNASGKIFYTIEATPVRCGKQAMP